MSWPRAVLFGTCLSAILTSTAACQSSIRACARHGSRYRLALGPYAGHVGRGGVSRTKGEGDLRAPAGVFPLRDGFGVNDNPGLGARS